MKKYEKNNLPNYLIALLIILLFPVGVYFLVLKTENNLKGIKRTALVLIECGYLALAIVTIYLLINFGSYLSLFDSHMNSDMYNFKFLYFYIYSIIVIISTLVGGIHLNKICNKLNIYTEFINVKHVKDIDLICEETNESLEKVVENINKLIDKNYLLNVKVEENHLISTTTVDKNERSKYIRCIHCGNYMKKKSSKVRCDFCNKKIK